MNQTLIFLLLVLISLTEAEEFKPLPSEEDWRGSDRALKDMRLGKDTGLSLGGSARVRSFEGLRGTWLSDEERLDAFWFRPTANLTGAFNNRWLDAPSWLAGAYYHRPGQEYYVVRYQDARASFQDAAGIEQRWTAGGRWFGTPGPWSYDFEAFYQLGTIGASDIRAWSIASNTSYQVESWPGSPRFSLKANVVSGDSAPDDDRLNTFNAMFPNGSYFGEIADLPSFPVVGASGEPFGLFPRLFHCRYGVRRDGPVYPALGEVQVLT